MAGKATLQVILKAKCDPSWPKCRDCDEPIFAMYGGEIRFDTPDRGQVKCAPCRGQDWSLSRLNRGSVRRFALATGAGQ